MWGRIIALIIKEFLIVLRDSRARFVLIVPPVIQLCIFSFAATLDVKNVPIGILNLDNGERAFELIERFQGTPFFSKITFLQKVSDIDHFIDNQEGLMVVFFDELFSRKIDAKETATLQLVLDGRRSNSAQIVTGYTTQIVQRYNDDLAAQGNVPQQNIDLVVRNWFNPNLLYYWFNVPSLVGTLVMIVALVLTSLSIAREKEIGTFDQLLVSPLTPFEILVGKMVPAIIFSMIEAIAFLIIGVYLLEVPFEGSVLLFLASVFVFISSIVGVGLFISSLSMTQQQAVLGTYVFIPPSIMLSGFATPVENMPTWLQPVTYLLPLKYFLIISKGIFLKNTTPEIVWHNTWPMAIIAAVTLSFSCWFFKRRLE